MDNRGLLIIDDDAGLQTQLKWHFSEANYNVLAATDYESAIETIRKYEPAVVIQDLGLPPHEDSTLEGFKVMEQIQRLSHNSKVVVVTAMDADNALRAVSLGAYDFFSKPVNLDVLDLVINRAFQMWDLEQKSRRRSHSDMTEVGGFVTADPSTLKTCSRLRKIAANDVTCLLRGESGTGKELLARLVHAMSSRKDGPFVAINCAALPETLIESELFGYEKGAFTGAEARKRGRVESAHNGTLFLDEIGDMPLPAQAKVLRFVEQRTVDRVGGRREVPIDVRIVCATNRDLGSMVEQGTFREDLYYRVAEVEIKVPPLRDRGDDRVLLAKYYLDKLSRQLKYHNVHFDKSALAAISTYSWPGNVRELISKIRNAIVMTDAKLITADDLGILDQPGLMLNLRDVRQTAERSAVLRSLLAADGKIAVAARLLGITRPTLYSLMKRYSIGSDELRTRKSEGRDDVHSAGRG